MKTSHLLVLAVLVTATVHAQQQPSIDGRWKVVTGSRSVRNGSYLDLLDSGEEVTGNYIDSGGRVFPIQKSRFDKGELKLDLEASYQESRFTIELRGRFNDEGYFDGVAVVRGRESKIRLKRLSDPVGVWDVLSRSEDGERRSRSVLRIRLEAGGYRGTLDRGGKSVDLGALRWKRERLVLRFDGSLTDPGGPFSVVASFQDVNRLKGRWKVDGAKPSPVSGAWSASRRNPIVTIDGGWLVTPSNPDLSFTSSLTIVDSDDGLHVSFGTEFVDSKSARFDGRKLTMELELEIDTKKTTIRIEAKLADADTLEGQWWTANAPSPIGAWVAKRQHPPRAKAADFAGTWKASTSLNDGSELAFEMVLEARGDRITGRFLSPRGNTDLYEVELDERLHFAVRLNGSDGPLRLDFVASVRQEGMRGEWTTPDGNSRQWFAERAKN